MQVYCPAVQSIPCTVQSTSLLGVPLPPPPRKIFKNEHSEIESETTFKFLQLHVSLSTFTKFALHTHFTN